MLWSEETVRAAIRNRAGERVFFLSREDTLTPSARDYLRREKIRILPAEEAKQAEFCLENGAVFQEKPEHFTHLRGNTLVAKTHPVIAFRGAMDTLQAQILLAQTAVPDKARKDLEEILELARQIIGREVMEEPLEARTLCGLTQDELRRHSHFPQEYYGQPHFMPAYSDGEGLLRLNAARCAARAAELAAAAAFTDRSGNCTRVDILKALNRMSSMLYILMIRQKAGR